MTTTRKRWWAVKWLTPVGNEPCMTASHNTPAQALEAAARFTERYSKKVKCRLVEHVETTKILRTFNSAPRR